MTRTKTIRSSLRAGASACLVAGVWTVGAAVLRAPSLAAQESIELRRHVPPDAYLKIYGGGGTVEVVGWDRDSLVVTGTRRPGPGRFFHIVDGGVGKLGFEVAEQRAGEVDADLRVHIPASSTVWIKVVSASVTVRGLEGPLDVLSVSGRVEVVGSSRAVYVESMAGDVRLELAAAGVVRAKAGRGDVTVRGGAENLTLSSVGGSIDVDGSVVRRAELESIDGRIDFRGGVARGGWLAADTHTGDVDLVLPADLGAAFDLVTVQGRIETELRARPVSRPGFPGSRMTFETGAGEAVVEVRSFAGTIRVRADPALSAEQP